MNVSDARERFPSMLFLDGFENAFIGIAHVGKVSPKQDGNYVACYSYEKIKSILMWRGMDSEGADNYISFHILGAYFGSNTPLVIE
jgi:hypothetical protein